MSLIYIEGAVEWLVRVGEKMSAVGGLGQASETSRTTCLNRTCVPQIESPCRPKPRQDMQIPMECAIVPRVKELVDFENGGEGVAGT